MFQIGDQVVYGVHGVCQIIDLQIQKINYKKVEYYVLEPIRQPGARFFVPSQIEIASSKLRPVLTRVEVDQLLRSAKNAEDRWTDDENLRKQLYRDLISTCDRCAILRMIRSLHNHKDIQLQTGKKFHISDANFLKDAEKMIYSEIALVLEMPYEDIEAYIENY